MVRLTYVVEEPAPSSSAVQPVNLAFAAAAAARASWASKERDDYYWDFGPLDGGVSTGAALGGADGLEGSFLFGGARPVDTELQTAPPRVSGAGLGGFGTGAPTTDGRSIHDIPRNSVLYRTHAAQQTMTSSLPPAEPTPPSAIQVAAVMEERKSRGLVNLPDDALAAATSRGTLLRSASFSYGLEPAGAAALRAIAESGAGGSRSATGSGTNNAVFSPPYTGKPSSYTGSFVVGAAGAATAVRDALSSTGMHYPAAAASIDDKPMGQSEELLEGGDGGEAERDGCLVLPVLRTLLAMQQDDAGVPKPAPRVPPTHIGSTGHGHGHGHAYSHAHSQLLHGAHLHIQQPTASGHFSRQASLHALRASTSSALVNGSTGGGLVVVVGGGGGGSLSRQATVTNTSSPARRRVAVGGGGGGGSGGEHAAAAAPRLTLPPRRQYSVKPNASYPMAFAAGGGGGGAAAPDDDDPFGLSAFDPTPRAMSYSAAAGQASPMVPPTQPASTGSTRFAARTSTGLGMAPPPVDGGGGGAASLNVHGGTLGGSSSSSRTFSPPPAARQTGGSTARGAATKQQQHSQPQPPQQSPQPQPPAQQPAPGKTKSGRALFAWTNKLGKGKWPWLSGGGGGGAAAAGSSNSAASGGAAAGGGGAVGGKAIGQPDLSLHATSVHGTPLYGPPSAHVTVGPGGGDAASGGGGGGSALTARALRSSISGNGRSISSNGRLSSNGACLSHGYGYTYGDGSGGGGDGAASPQGPASPRSPRLSMMARDAVQLPPIEQRRRSAATGAALSLGPAIAGEPGSPHAGLRRGSSGQGYGAKR
ncbi:hypothetical protein PLESTB_001714000 [Pleodorina starrii]|uniref:Uncharacterized protein n=1 Tax=Pleodorina starrii TaxID=330485 RepID=A0A9W6F9B0_9CHLO|nr:hypothetical protein PLESTM_000790000 [Pleodorina starrii]GLC61078.1 hypothetical protein PLESTB_001714000 [Pleodorina starrii]GLC75877.1 hypothetical protein PLESTF_001699500 [Pleodorina starrii]